jgi:hypothetical protein
MLEGHDERTVIFTHNAMLTHKVAASPGNNGFLEANGAAISLLREPLAPIEFDPKVTEKVSIDRLQEMHHAQLAGAQAIVNAEVHPNPTGGGSRANAQDPPQTLRGNSLCANCAKGSVAQTVRIKGLPKGLLKAGSTPLPVLQGDQGYYVECDPIATEFNNLRQDLQRKDARIRDLEREVRSSGHAVEPTQPRVTNRYQRPAPVPQREDRSSAFRPTTSYSDSRGSQRGQRGGRDTGPTTRTVGLRARGTEDIEEIDGDTDVADPPQNF